MKSTRLSLLAALLAAAATGAYAAWGRARPTVTLDVANAPLSEVLAKIERQVGRNLRAEESLAGVHVTLHAKDTPLTQALDGLAEQAGARWSTLYAVYGAKRALDPLEAALRGRGVLAPAGWTELDPRSGSPGGPATAQDGSSNSRPSGNQRQHGPGRGGGGRGPAGPPEPWPLEELVVESALRDRLGHTLPAGVASLGETAAEMARTVGGGWTTYLAFHPTDMGIGFQMPRGAPKLRPPDPNRRLWSLPPEQRVQLARQPQGGGG